MPDSSPTQPLKNKVALVTGASRGIGKGVAIALAKEGAKVYITGRTELPSQNNSLSGSLQETQEAIHAFGGHCVSFRCDHTNDTEVEPVFEVISKNEKTLDIVVNSAWGGYEHFNDGTEFWKEEGFWSAPMDRWDKMFTAGVRAAYNSCRLAAGIMIKQGSGLLVNLSYWASQRNDMGVAYGLSKSATDRMTAIIGHELKPHKIAAVCLYPGIVRTEAVLKAADHFDLSNSESPEFTGRVISGLAQDPKLMEKSGKTFVGAQLALEYGVHDVDGKRPRPLSADDV